ARSPLPEPRLGDDDKGEITEWLEDPSVVRLCLVHAYHFSRSNRLRAQILEYACNQFVATQRGQDHTYARGSRRGARPRGPPVFSTGTKRRRPLPSRLQSFTRRVQLPSKTKSPQAAAPCHITHPLRRQVAGQQRVAVGEGKREASRQRAIAT